MASRYERRLKLGTELGVDIKGLPLHVLRDMHKQKFPRIETPKRQASKAKGKVKVTGGTIDPSKLPSAELCDRNGRPLHGAALDRRIEKLNRTGDAPENTAIVVSPVTDVTDSVDIVRFEAIEEDLGQMKTVLESVLEKLMELASASK